MPQLTWEYLKQEISANWFGIWYVIFLYGAFFIYATKM